MTEGDPCSELRLLLFDVDGILTDNGLYVGDDGTSFKRFNIADGMGIRLASMAGLETGLISGHASNATIERARRLGMAYCEVGVTDKIPVFEDILARAGLEPRQAAFMGDDYLDAPVLKRAGFAATVPEAPEAIRGLCDLVTTSRGGHGAVREMIEHVLRASGRLDPILERFL